MIRSCCARCYADAGHASLSQKVESNGREGGCGWLQGMVGPNDLGCQARVSGHCWSKH